MVPEQKPFSLYVHIPYCISKCPYCDFNSHVVSEIPEKGYTAALLKELDLYSGAEGWDQRGLKSIFFGGGTPSTFSPESVGKILEKAEVLFSFTHDIEISLEANPGTVDSKNFWGYRACGVNRISIGAQTFHPHLLRFLGRVHSAEETRDALRIVRRAGFTNFNLDLIYAIPAQSLPDLKADLEEALSFDPPHLSAYNLTMEEGTPFYREYRVGKIRPLSEEEEISMAELIEETLPRAGLKRYEISNYARANFHSRHNSNYWQGGDYLGVGAGAHSYQRMIGDGIRGRRWHNEKNPSRYMEKITHEGKAIVGEENTEIQQAAGEFMFLGLRMIEGISVEEFSRRFGKAPREFYPRINDWIEEGLMREFGGRLHLTRRGLLVADAIFVNFA